MGIFGAVSEGIYAAKVMRGIARQLDIPLSAVHEFQKEAIKQIATMYKRTGYTVDQAVVAIVQSIGNQIKRDCEDNISSH